MPVFDSFTFPDKLSKSVEKLFNKIFFLYELPNKQKYKEKSTAIEKEL